MKLGRRQEGSILGAGNAQSLSRCHLLTLIIQLNEHIVLYVCYTEIKWFTKKKKVLERLSRKHQEEEEETAGQVRVRLSRT